MSRKNKTYGNQWLEKHYSLFWRTHWYSVHALGRFPDGPWWARQSSWRIKKYEVARFETIAEFKTWFRKRASGRRKTRKILEFLGTKANPSALCLKCGELKADKTCKPWCESPQQKLDWPNSKLADEIRSKAKPSDFDYFKEITIGAEELAKKLDESTGLSQKSEIPDTKHEADKDQQIAELIQQRDMALAEADRWEKQYRQVCEGRKDDQTEIARWRKARDQAWKAMENAHESLRKCGDTWRENKRLKKERTEVSKGAGIAYLWFGGKDGWQVTSFHPSEDPAIGWPRNGDTRMYINYDAYLKALVLKEKTEDQE